MFLDYRVYRPTLILPSFVIRAYMTHFKAEASVSRGPDRGLGQKPREHVRGRGQNFGIEACSLASIALTSLEEAFIELARQAIFSLYVTVCTVCRTGVVMATGLVNGKPRFLDPQESKIPEQIDIKLDRGDYVGDLTPHANFGISALNCHASSVFTLCPEKKRPKCFL